jgi:hypothetical protein
MKVLRSRLMVEEFRSKIAAAQKRMNVDHEEAKVTLLHSGNKGTSYEVAFRTALASCLPVNLQFGNGEVIDSLGHRSKQTDVVIVSREHPGTFTPELPELFYVEAVLAAGEVKAILTSDELATALSNSVSFRQLEIVHQVGSIAMTPRNPAENRYYRCPPFFLFAYESQLTLETVRDRIRAFQNNASLHDEGLINGVFLLDRGWLINFGDGHEEFQFRTAEGQSVPGWVGNPSSEVLLELVRWLSIVMPTAVYIPPLPRIYLAPTKA